MTTAVPWLELAVLTPLVGALLVRRVRRPERAADLSAAVTGLTLAFAAGAWAAGEPALLPRVFKLDGVSGFLLPAVAVLHLLTVLTSGRSKTVSFAWLLAGEAVQLATFACRDPWVLAGLLALGTLPPAFDLARRGASRRVYAVHMAVFVALLGAGLAAASPVVLMLAVLVRSGTVPAHLWVTDLIENGSFGGAITFVAPLTGVYAAVRLVLPTAPDWVLQGIGAASLVTAVYAAGMAVVQTDARRFFGFLFLSQAALVLVGLELHTVISLTGGLALWGAGFVSLGGLGLTLRAVEARFGRLALTEYRGLYHRAPALAVCFLLTGLAGIGFPGTLGFVAVELLVDGAVGVNPFVGLVVTAAAAVNGIALLRVYFLLFTGARPSTGVAVPVTPRERVAALALAALIVGGGLVPQPHISSRHRAASTLLRERAAGQSDSHPVPAGVPTRSDPE